MNSIAAYVLTMAGVTLAIRYLPLVLLRREITNPFIRSFLYYTPFVTLSVMVFPAVLHSTAHVESAALGTVAAALLALKSGNLMLVTAVAGLVALGMEMML